MNKEYEYMKKMILLFVFTATFTFAINFNNFSNIENKEISVYKERITQEVILFQKEISPYITTETYNNIESFKYYANNAKDIMTLDLVSLSFLDYKKELYKELYSQQNNIGKTKIEETSN